jgi:hypothetical protein
MIFDKGIRVNTPHGTGTVVYHRLLGPDYREADCYSVCLDEHKAASERPPFPSYTGTIVPADQVQPLKQGQ